MQNTPLANRIHIALFGRRNAGKSSLINAITGQDLAIVSDIPGTTTDPVYKTMELLPLGPVVIIDTPGIDDCGKLGEKRIAKSLAVLNKTDIALVVADARLGLSDEEEELIRRVREKKIPIAIVFTKDDIVENCSHKSNKYINSLQIKPLFVSNKTGEGIFELKEYLATLYKEEIDPPKLVSDLVKYEDIVVLVIPIDKAAPKGRLILPQQQVIRELLDIGAIPLILRDTELENTMARLIDCDMAPELVITDSQVFSAVANIVPESIDLTSFSILFARYKGELATQLEGVEALDKLANGDKVLIAEGCTHHRQCDDIGTVKLPKWIDEYTKKHLQYDYTSGVEFPQDLSPYRLIIHCGGCMLNTKEMGHRIHSAQMTNKSITNYGMVIAKTKNLLDRSLKPLFRYP